MQVVAIEFGLLQSMSLDSQVEATYLGRLHLANFGNVAFVVQAIAQQVAKGSQRSLEGVRYGFLLALKAIL
jgi:hypothetical protein